MPSSRTFVSQGRAVPQASVLSHRWTAFAAAHPAESGWIMENVDRNGFAYSLRQGVMRWGSLTERQLAAVRNALQRNINPANPGHAPAPSRIEVDATALRAALDTAVQAGLRRVALTYGDIRISLAGPTSRNPGAIYVTFRGAYVGALRGGEFRRGRGEYFNALPTERAREEFLANLRTIAANPHEQAVLHGRRTGSCCCCGRTLTDPESVAAGIGPICRGRFGWGGTTLVRRLTASERPRHFEATPLAEMRVAARPPINDRDGMEAEDL